MLQATRRLADAGGPIRFLSVGRAPWPTSWRQAGPARAGTSSSNFSGYRRDPVRVSSRRRFLLSSRYRGAPHRLGWRRWPLACRWWPPGRRRPRCGHRWAGGSPGSGWRSRCPRRRRKPRWAKAADRGRWAAAERRRGRKRPRSCGDGRHGMHMRPERVLPIPEKLELLAQPEPVPLCLQLIGQGALPDAQEADRVRRRVGQPAGGLQHRRVVLLGSPGWRRSPPPARLGPGRARPGSLSFAASAWRMAVDVDAGAP